MKPMLSKSRFLAGLQCPLRLWYQCYDRKLATPASPTQQAIFDMGHEVGMLATKLFPAGLYVHEDYLHHPEAQKTTESAIRNPNVPAIFEGAFYFSGIRIRVDILERLKKERWKMIEVKSSTAVDWARAVAVAGALNEAVRRAFGVGSVPCYAARSHTCIP